MKYFVIGFVCALSQAAFAAVESTPIAAYSCEGNEKWIILPTPQDGRFSFELIIGKASATRVMKGTLSVGPVPSSGLVSNESGKAIGRFQTHGAEITAEIGDAVLRCGEASQTLAVMIGRQTQRTMAERKRSVAGRAEGVSCEAECKISCEDVVFEESPDKFSTQKCKDYGGVGAYSGGKFLCKAWRRDASRVFGYGQMTHEAQKAAAESCQARPAPCSRPMHKPIRTVGSYVCS